MDLNRPAILEFVNKLRSFSSREAYSALVDAAQTHFSSPTTELWKSLFTHLDPKSHAGSPGHDFGHARRDFLDALALASDTKTLANYLPAEIVAGILAGTFHDLGTAITRRYNDNDWLAGHAEIGAWYFFTETANLLEENLRYLAAYAIASHTHYLKNVECKDGSTREPWWYELFDLNNHQYGWAVLACRFADRLDTNGSTLIGRHFLANSDAAETPGAKDLTATTFYEVNRESISFMVKPEKKMFKTSTGTNAPSAILHINNFANSNFGQSVYSRDDYIFPLMSRLMGYKVAQAMTIASLLKPASFWDKLAIGLRLINIQKLLKSLLWRTSRAPRFHEAWTVLAKAFNQLSVTEKAIWINIIYYLNWSYDLWLDTLKSIITDNPNDYTKPVLPLLDQMINEIR